MLSTILAAAVLCVSPADRAAAVSDYAQQIAVGNDCRYLSLDAAIADQEPAARFMVTLASRQALLDASVPVRLPGTNVLRLSLTGLLWDRLDWIASMGHPANPYTPHQDPLLVPAGFFLDRASDLTTGDTYYRLYFGGKKIPKTLDQFYAAIGVDPDESEPLAIRWVEGKSRVNVARAAARLVRHDDGTNAEAWTTFDVRTVEPGRDPLEALFDGDFRADGTELFALVPRVSTLGVRGVLPVVALANGSAGLVAEAPVDLVEDASRFKGQAAIRAPGSCVTCHTAGSQRQAVNALRAALESGVDLKSYSYDQQVRIEVSHLGDVNRALDRWDEGYSAALGAVNGLTPAENAAAFARAIDAYRADVTIGVAGRDLGCAPEDLRLALGYASANRILIGSRLSILAHGGAIPRSAWEGEYLRAQAYLETWRVRN